MNIFEQLADYIKGAISEMKKVVWPSRKETIQYSAIVIAMSIGMAIFFGILDYVFGIGLELLIS